MLYASHSRESAVKLYEMDGVNGEATHDPDR
jgi:hypothetical protein